MCGRRSQACAKTPPCNCSCLVLSCPCTMSTRLQTCDVMPSRWSRTHSSYNGAKQMFFSYRYFRRLQRRYARQSHETRQAPEAKEQLEASSSQAEQNGSDNRELAERPGSLQTPVTCINLLRCNMQVSWHARALCLCFSSYACLALHSHG